jgi:hypothetical protein
VERSDDSEGELLSDVLDDIAWRPEFTAAMYFLLMGPEYPFDRFGDIWGACWQSGSQTIWAWQ